jgi:hypothetical protein
MRDINMKIESNVCLLGKPKEVLRSVADKHINVKVETELLDIIKSVVYKIMGYDCDCQLFASELSDSLTKMINVTLFDNKSPLYCDDEYAVANFIYTSQEIKEKINCCYFKVKGKSSEDIIYHCAKLTHEIKHIIEQNFML